MSHAPILAPERLAMIQCDCGAVTQAVHELAEAFGRAIDAKDGFTKQHSDETALAAHTLALSLGLSAREADIVHIAGHLHDVGKIGVPDAVLAKPGRLSVAEWAMVRAHPEIGAEILAPVTALAAMGVPAMVRGHHERFDGSGYPDGLRGKAIPLGARIIAVADSLSAMLQDRPYRGAMGFEAAAREIAAGSGSQFDPAVVDAFRRCADSVRLCVESLATSPPVKTAPMALSSPGHESRRTSGGGRATLRASHDPDSPRDA